MILDHEVCTLLQGLYSGHHSQNSPALINCSNMFLYFGFVPLCEVCVFAHLLLLHNQGPEHMPQMHCSLKAYCATFLTPLTF